MALPDPLALPVHPRTGLSAIGLLRDGSPIWPVLGGSEDAGGGDESDGDAPESGSEDNGTDEAADDSGDTEESKNDAKNDEDDKPLGPAGEKALNAEKAKRRETAKLLRQTRAELAQLKQAVERQSSNGAAGDGEDDEAPDLDAIRAEAAEEAKAAARAEVLAERVSDRIEVLAAKRFKDSDDALAHLTRNYEPDDFLDGGKVDVEAIKEALDELLEAKPYLAVPAQGEAKRFKGSGDGGAKPTKQPRPGSHHEALSRELNKP